MGARNTYTRVRAEETNACPSTGCKKHWDLEARTYQTPGEVFHFCLGHHGPTLSCDFSSFVSRGAWEMERMKRTKTEKEGKNISDRSQTTFSRLLR